MTIWVFLKEEATVAIRSHQSRTGRWRSVFCLTLALIFFPRYSWPAFLHYLGHQFGRLFDFIVNRRYWN